MDSTLSVDASPSMLRSVEHCSDLIIAGNLAAMTYAEANLPSFSSGESGPDFVCCLTFF